MFRSYYKDGSQPGQTLNDSMDLISWENQAKNIYIWSEAGATILKFPGFAFILTHQLIKGFVCEFSDEFSSHWTCAVVARGGIPLLHSKEIPAWNTEFQLTCETELGSSIGKCQAYRFTFLPPYSVCYSCACLAKSTTSTSVSAWKNRPVLSWIWGILPPSKEAKWVIPTC